ncbi:hypothetical protein [Robiginitalea biformata]|uniref:Uncharacterized protein n=1 Tax=Robiginitalea biformata (strain ATCC BAA-864 / DSM 15991 / KCTC 12146 / HTCC2501) TaxID=313596 RepID=A4CIW9_ROBBH|nr:hypothetical protein [Robiginitalea biformata]EAR16877.1 hypothetical protein RB2501_08245 [Robiginitalea biformata HTCC2501]
MTRFNSSGRLQAFVFILLLALAPASAQQKQEREFRIRKAQFPESAREVMEPYLEGVRRLRYYKEIDSARSSFEMKFKHRRLHYSIEFTPEGELEDAEVRIRPVDIPNETLEAIQAHLKGTYGRYRVRKIQQQYPRASFESDTQTLKNAFQNLLLPEIRYELVIQTRQDSGLAHYEFLYDSEGRLLRIRESLPPNYNHVLY